MRFWMVSGDRNIQKDLLWNFWLCSSLNFIAKKLWYVSGCVVHWGFDLWAIDRKSAFWGRKEELNYVKNIECNFLNKTRLTSLKYSTRSISQKKPKTLLSSWYKKIQHYVLSTRYCLNIHFFRCVLQKLSQKSFNEDQSSLWKIHYYFLSCS